jgi:hypothetical protein
MESRRLSRAGGRQQSCGPTSSRYRAIGPKRKTLGAWGGTPDGRGERSLARTDEGWLCDRGTSHLQQALYIRGEDRVYRIWDTSGEGRVGFAMLHASVRSGHVCATVQKVKHLAAEKFFIPLGTRSCAILGGCPRPEFRHDSCNTAPR